ncbi:hypothetical protein N0V82_004761 [Gnomoniopsis sp. IMI 355080]|nr:hypothetical protein N0V82_004761 [Gnomoniopsis sp. IMI 355080]
MSSMRALKTVSSVARPGLSATYRRQVPRVSTSQQVRWAAAKGDGEKDDLGGPGGQEPVDPTARDKQNASLRNKTIAAMILIGGPIFYMLAKPDQVAAKAPAPNNSGPNKL